MQGKWQEPAHLTWCSIRAGGRQTRTTEQDLCSQTFIYKNTTFPTWSLLGFWLFLLFLLGQTPKGTTTLFQVMPDTAPPHLLSSSFTVISRCTNDPFWWNLLLKLSSPPFVHIQPFLLVQNIATISWGGRDVSKHQHYPGTIRAGTCGLEHLPLPNHHCCCCSTGSPLVSMPHSKPPRLQRMEVLQVLPWAGPSQG